MIKVHVYPDGEQYEEPLATCECGTQEWYK